MQGFPLTWRKINKKVQLFEMIKTQSQVIGSHLLPDLLLLLLGRVPPSFSTGPVHLYFGPLVYCIYTFIHFGPEQW